MVSMAKWPVTQSPQGNAENFIRKAKISKKKVKIKVFKVNKKGANKNIRKWVFNKRKSNSSLLKVYIYLLWPKTNSWCYCKLERYIVKERELSGKNWSE